MGTFLLVCICGGLGAVARFMLNTSIQRWWHRAYPLSTFSTAINEMVSLTRTRQLAVAAFYFLTTLVVPFCAVVLGWFFGSIGH